jgi:hypothetical protein
VRGMALLYDGDAARATVSLELGLKLNRYDPQNFVWYTLAALAFLFDGRAERASERAVAALKIRPAWRAAVRAAAGASAALGTSRRAPASSASGRKRHRRPTRWHRCGDAIRLGQHGWRPSRGGREGLDAA